jgi:hypothetical protein
MLSGGTDSMAVWQVLTRVLGSDFKVITTDFGRGFSFEARGFEQFRRDVTCRTDFRRMGFNHEGRFTAAVPLLFADYADLHSFSNGYCFGDVPQVWRDPREGGQSEFEAQEAASAAGGLREVHLLRSLTPAATLRLLATLAPERVERALLSSSGPGSGKYLDKGVMLRHAFQQLGRPLPDYLAHLPFPSEPPMIPRRRRVVYLYTIWHWKFLDRETALLISPQIADHDFSRLAGLSMDLYRKYIPRMTRFLPDDIREAIVDGFQRVGIEPFDERDYAELEQLRQFIVGVNRRGVLHVN